MARGILACAVALLLAVAAVADGPKSWLSLLNAEPGREQPLTETEVVFRPSASAEFPGLVAAGFPQSDGTLVLGSLIWDGKVFSPLAGYGSILKEKGFLDASDQQRAALFLAMLRQTNATLGIHPYNGAKSREEGRPQPLSGFRQVDGQHRFVVWYCEEPGTREGPEWRQVIYLVNADATVVRARTLGTYHPEAENLPGFPPIPSEPSE